MWWPETIKPTFFLILTRDFSISLISTFNATTMSSWSFFVNKDLSAVANVSKFFVFLHLSTHLSFLSMIWLYHQPLWLHATQLGLNDFSFQEVHPLAFAYRLHKLQLHDYNIQEPPLVLGPTDAQKLFKCIFKFPCTFSFIHSYINLTHLHSYLNITKAKFFIWLNCNRFIKICPISSRTKDQKSKGKRSVIQPHYNPTSEIAKKSLQLHIEGNSCVSFSPIETNITYTSAVITLWLLCKKYKTINFVVDGND